MSNDLTLFSVCDHKMVEEQLTITVGGTTTAVLKYLTNKNTDNILVFRKYWNTVVPHYTGISPYTTGWSLGADGKTLTFTTGSVVTNTATYPFPIYLCNYIAVLNSCPKCSASAVMGDVKYDLYGKINCVSNADKLKQYVKKAIITGIASNNFHKEYGTYLFELPGYRLTPQTIMKINSTMENIASYLKSYQEESFNLNNYEILYNISDINIERTNERTLGVNLTILNREYEEIVSYTEAIL